MLLEHRRAFANLVYGLDLALLYGGAIVGTLYVAGQLPGAPVIAAEAAVGTLAWTWLAARIDLYASRRTAGIAAEMWDLALSTIFALGVVTLVRASFGDPRGINVAVAAAAAMAPMGATRVAVRGALRAFRRRGRNTRNIVLVGRGSASQKIADDYRKNPHYGIQILGELHFSGEETRSGVDGVESWGPVANLESVLRQHAVDEVLVCPSDAVWATEVKSVLRFLDTAGLNCRVAPDFMGVPLERTSVSMTADVPTYSVHTGFGGARWLAIKRLVDVLGATVALLLLAPVFAAIALVISLTSRGPVFFKQTRLGLHGRPFQVLKFRSMVVDAERLREQLVAENEQSGPVFKMQHDPRITPIGRVLRRYSLDELPQLVNVLTGDMSLVGPRPPLPSEVEEYDWWQRRRLSVRPGITCIWQVSGRNAISFDRWMELDMQYIDGWSLAMDLRIMAKTVREVVRGGGA
ncbi:MAG: sugar transferase [Planctomycetota bacterium]